MAIALAIQTEQPGNYDYLIFEERIGLLTDSERHER
jgi:hypothetical protein